MFYYTHAVYYTSRRYYNMWENQGGGGNRTIAARRIPLYCYYHTRNNIISYRVNTYLCTLPALEARTSEKRSDIIIIHATRVLHVL